MDLGTRLFIGGLALALGLTACAPLVGINVLLYNMSLTNEPVATNFLVIRCATFATLAFFSVNFLSVNGRYRRWRQCWFSATSPYFSGL